MLDESAVAHLKKRKLANGTPLKSTQPSKPATEEPDSEASSSSSSSSAAVAAATADTQSLEERSRALVEAQIQPQKSFKDLGIIDPLCEACAALGYKAPTPIQSEAIPLALQGRDLIGLAETGSGKTAAFALPILQALMEEQRSLFALVLAPTRELAVQISQYAVQGITLLLFVKADRT